jgi:GNAT superfamily N-acetyltransferase
MRRHLGGGYELDDDRPRIDRRAVHAFLSRSYWAAGRERDVNDELIDGAELVVGLYRGTALIGYCRVVSDYRTVAYLADVFVLEAHRGLGLGIALVMVALDHPNLAHARKWFLHTKNMHRLYARAGFREPDGRLMERWRDTPQRLDRVHVADRTRRGER